ILPTTEALPDWTVLQRNGQHYLSNIHSQATTIYFTTVDSNNSYDIPQFPIAFSESRGLSLGSSEYEMVHMALCEPVSRLLL
uniref:Uncharacterized protein n=1 Tax=Periophthalmus magnuspinnatus TaxID=409849 RepID=A0A3B4A975_9GOBI